MLFIWLVLSGSLLYSGLIEFVGESSQFFNIIVVAGIILGFLQYYLKRHEEKVQNKITKHLSNYVQSKDEFTFEEFNKFVEKEASGDIRRISKNVDEGKIKDWFSVLNIPRRSGKEIEAQSMNIHLSGGKDQLNLVKFRSLEKKAEEKGIKEKLLEAYNEFFKKKKSQVLKQLDEKYMEKVSWLLLGNINILEEAFPPLFKFQSKDKELQSYKDYLVKTQLEIADEAVAIAIGLKESEE